MNPLEDTQAGFHPSRRLVIIGGIILLAIVLPITTVMAVLYMMWQASPEKAFADAAAYARVTPATYRVTSGANDATVRYDGTRLAATGTYGTAQFDAVLDNQTVYVKTPTPEKFVAMFTADSIPTSLQPLVGTVTKLVTNRWVSLSLDQLPFGKAAGSNDAVCASNADSQLTANADAAGELAQTYTKHAFMQVATTKAGDMTTYDVTFDTEKTTAFWDAFEKTTYYQSLSTDCANLLHMARTIDMSHSSAHIVLNDKTHALQSMQLALPNKQQVAIAVTYGNQSNVTVPTGALSYDSITNSIWQSVFGQGFGTNSR